MNWDQIASSWKLFRGTVKQKWGKFTHDNAVYLAGTRDRLIGRLQEKYGYTKDDAELRADWWLTRQQGRGRKSFFKTGTSVLS